MKPRSLLDWYRPTGTPSRAAGIDRGSCHHPGITDQVEEANHGSVTPPQPCGLSPVLVPAGPVSGLCDTQPRGRRIPSRGAALRVVGASLLEVALRDAAGSAVRSGAPCRHVGAHTRPRPRDFFVEERFAGALEGSRGCDG